MTGTVLILGATGRFGRNAAEAFERHGWDVSRFDRKTGDLMQAARGADVIVNGWNPPYDQWAKLVPDLTRQVINAAKSAGATVVLPGNVYVYGDPLPNVLGPDTPHRATNPLGRIRRDLEGAYRASGVQTIVMRAGDYIDTEASGNWFDKVMVKDFVKGRFVYPGRRDVTHAFAYLPDLAEATVRVVEGRAALSAFEDIAFPGYALTGQELGDALAALAPQPLKISSFNWLPVRAMSPVWKLGRHLVEMRYLWDQSHMMDNDRFNALVPGFEPTPMLTALGRAVEHQIHPKKAVA